MAKHTPTDPAAATQPAATDADKDTLTKRGVAAAAEQGFLKIRKPVARWIARNMPDPLKDRAKTWAAALPYISILIATLSPDKGIWQQIDAFQQDLFDAIEEELKNPSAQVEDLSTDTTARLNTLALVMRAVNELAPADRQDFEEWYFETFEHQVGFNQLVAGADKDTIKSMAVRSKLELERMIKPVPKLTVLDLQQTATNEVTAFLAHINTAGQDRTPEFWNAVEKRQMKSVGEFESVMKMPDDQILGYLHMPHETVKHRFGKVTSSIAATIDEKLGSAQAASGQPETGLMKWSSELLTKAKKSAGI